MYEAWSFTSHCVVYELLQEWQVWASNGQPSLSHLSSTWQHWNRKGRLWLLQLLYVEVRKHQVESPERKKRTFPKRSKMLLREYTGVWTEKNQETLHSHFHGCLQIRCNKKRRSGESLQIYHSLSAQLQGAQKTRHIRPKHLSKTFEPTRISEIRIFQILER